MSRTDEEILQCLCDLHGIQPQLQAPHHTFLKLSATDLSDIVAIAISVHRGGTNLSWLIEELNHVLPRRTLEPNDQRIRNMNFVQQSVLNRDHVYNDIIVCLHRLVSSIVTKKIPCKNSPHLSVSD